MFVAPHHQVNKIIQELLGNVVCGTVFTPKHEIKIVYGKKLLLKNVKKIHLKTKH